MGKNLKKNIYITEYIYICVCVFSDSVIRLKLTHYKLTIPQ